MEPMNFIGLRSLSTLGTRGARGEIHHAPMHHAPMHNTASLPAGTAFRRTATFAARPVRTQETPGRSPHTIPAFCNPPNPAHAECRRNKLSFGECERPGTGGGEAVFIGVFDGRTSP
eukprot:5032138-Prymnesium_polylepis.2